MNTRLTTRIVPEHEPENEPVFVGSNERTGAIGLDDNIVVNIPDNL